MKNTANQKEQRGISRKGSQQHWGFFSFCAKPGFTLQSYRSILSSIPLSVLSSFFPLTRPAGMTI